MGLLNESVPALLGAAEGGAHEGLSFAGLFVYLAITIIIVFAFLSSAKKGFVDRVFLRKPAQLAEQLYLFIEQMCVGTIGPHGRKYIPLIITLWLMIFTGNALALFFPASPTADLSFNIAMALISVFYVQYEGARSHGLIGHFRHFAGPKLAIFMLPITLMIFVIEIISELMKNVSLSLRLFGNIHGGHEAVSAMNRLGIHMFGWDFFNVPIGTFLLPIKLLTVVVQAMIFTLLTCVYLSLVTGHDEGHEHGNEHENALEPAHIH
ncbi:F0F1 ATP synthase subunit A [soil metagenome]